MRRDEAGAQVGTSPAEQADGRDWRALVARISQSRLARRIDWSIVAMIGVTFVALWLRLFNLNWDDNNHLHPDERKITMVAQCLGWKSVPPGCQPIPDPANPHFFAYGSFPMYLLALVAHGLAWLFHGHAGWPTDGGTFDDYNHITLVGRALSALFDTGTVVLAGLIARRLAGRWWGVFAAAFVAFTAFEIQLAHFYAVDTVLTFFVTLTLYGALGLAGVRRDAATPDDEAAPYPPIWRTLAWAALTGLAFGLAFTSKFSALPLLAPVGLALVIRWRRLGLGAWPDIALSFMGIVVTAFVTIIVTMPYMFLDQQEFWHDVNEQSALAKGTIVYPYTIQFAGRAPYLDQIKNLFFWDMGAVMTSAAIIGVAYAVSRVWRRWDDALVIPLAWVAIYFGVTGGFYTKFSRYQLPIFPMLAVFAAVSLAALHGWLRQTRLDTKNTNATRHERHENGSILRGLSWNLVAFVSKNTWTRWVAAGLAGIIIASGIVMSLAFLNIYTQPVTRVTASDWLYKNIPPGSVITHEIWDDPLPLPRPNGAPYVYQYLDMDLYSADTPDKADRLALQIANADVIILSSNRLKGSITRVPDTYPLTTHYYTLLFNGGLGFTLAHAPFQNYPHLGPFQFPDSQADESFSVYDHPTVWIFTRVGPRLSTDQIKARLLDGVSFPPVATQLASQKTLLLTPQATAADQGGPPLWQSLNPAGWATKLALPLWWLAVEILGLLAFPLAYVALPGLRDRGWGLAKILGMLLLGYFVWLPASLGFIPYERATVWLSFLALAGLGGGVFWARRRELFAFLRAHWRTILLTEAVVLGAFLFFTLIRSLDPDLWHIYRGGEKPMDFAFLNAILRSRSLPPLDPWFAGGAMNYYYFGQFLIATLIQLTGIVPTTAFNLAIPLLFALTISGAISVVYGISGRWGLGLLAGLFLAVAGNLDGLHQFWLQFQAWQAQQPIPGFDYWASSRVITPPYTINEFPFWSFLYADLHAHVIDLPVVLLGLGAAASCVNHLASWRGRLPTLALAALAIGAMACINTWDAPTYGAVFIAALLIDERRRMYAAVALQGGGWRLWLAQFTWPVFRNRIAAIIGVVAGAYLLFAPFYAHFQTFVSSTGPVTVVTDPVQFLTVFGVWLFLIVSFFVTEIADRWTAWVVRRRGEAGDTAQRALVLALVALIALTTLVLLGVKALLVGVILTGVALALDARHTPAKQFAFLLILAGASLALMIEIIYVRDFLDGGDWERMNTVFKFDYQIWLLWALGAALALGCILQRIFGGVWNGGWNTKGTMFTKGHEDGTGHGDHGTATEVHGIWGVADAQSAARGVEAVGAHEWPVDAPEVEWTPALERDTSGDVVHLGLRGAWLVTLIVLLFGSSIFLVQGTSARLADRTNWGVDYGTHIRQPVNGYASVPSLDGFAYMHAWFPGDAAAITWINEHVGGTPVILEASADPYAWYGRVSINTGLPAVLGWASHESQQRYPDEVYQRQPDVTAMYTLGDPAAVLPLLKQFHVRYVYVGQLECAAYGVRDPNPSFPSADTIKQCDASNGIIGSLSVFDQLAQQGQAKVVYQAGGVTIYEVG